MRRRVVLGTAVCVASVFAFVAQAAAGGNPMPPNNVYTCSWIAAHPTAAAAARVSCDPASIFWASITPPLEPQPTTSSTTATAGGINPAVCGSIPAGGNVGTGVFAWTGYYSSNFWSFTASLAQSYTEYVQKTDGTNVRNHSYSDDVSHQETGLPTLSYRWGAQNHGSWPMNWAYCHEIQ